MNVVYDTYIFENLQDNLEMEVGRQLRSMGIYRKLVGHKYLVTAIVQTVQDPDKIHYITKGLYLDVAKMYGSKASRVERTMRTAIRQCWEHGGREELDRVAGFHLQRRPTNSEFIDLMASYFRE